MSKITGLAARVLAERMGDIVRRKGYKFFDGNLSYNINLIGVRGNEDHANKFDDVMFLIYRDRNKQWCTHCYPITCDPGNKYLKWPINENGAAILVPGQYRGVYRIDKHRGQYDALCQRSGSVRVWRDDNRDVILDHDNETIMEGRYGINIHRAARSGEVDSVNGYSAGCQVFKRTTDFNELMGIAKKSSDAFGNSFTYTLLEEDDLGCSLSS
jgi:hypothetical protein